MTLGYKLLYWLYEVLDDLVWAEMNLLSILDKFEYDVKENECESFILWNDFFFINVF